MDIPHVFIDTNIYENAQFIFLEWSLKDIITAAEGGEIVLLLTEAIDKEIRGHIQEKVNQACNAIKEHPIIGIKAPKKRDAYEKCIAEYEKFISSCGAQVLVSTPDDCRRSFEMYLNDAPLFSQKGNPQFKDAITVSTLINWAEKRGISELLICSGDKKLREAMTANKQVRNFEKLNELMTFLTKKKDDLYSIYLGEAKTFITDYTEEFAEEIWKEIDDIQWNTSNPHDEVTAVQRGNIDFGTISISSISRDHITVDCAFDFIVKVDITGAVVVYDPIDKEEVTVGIRWVTRDEYHPGILTIVFLIEKTDGELTMSVEKTDITVPQDFELEVDESEWRRDSDMDDVEVSDDDAGDRAKEEE